MRLPQTLLGLCASFCRLWISQEQESLSHRDARGLGSAPSSVLFPAALSPTGRQVLSKCWGHGLRPQKSRPVGLSPQAMGVLILLRTREGGCCCHLSGGKGRQGKSGHGTSRCQGQVARKSLSAQEQAVWLEKRVCMKAGGWSGLESSSGPKPCHQAQ